MHLRAAIARSPFTPIVMACLIIVYIVWGSTYLAIALALEGMPPLLMTGSRFVVAGLFMVGVLAIRGVGLPTFKELLSCMIVGCSMLGLGVGGIAIAEQTISSGMASVGIATVPIWAVLLSVLFLREWPNSWEVWGILLGFAGVVVLNLEGGGIGNAGIGAVIIVAAALFWGLGSVLSKVLPVPEGMTGYAYEMLTGGIAITLIALMLGERMNTLPGPGALIALLYLVIGGSILAYSAYMYLLQNVRMSVATSYTLVTPIVAVGLGMYFLNENVGIYTALSLFFVLIGVACILRGREAK
ncbi:EamA family transporter [Kushneria aurantia]|uniref:EamA family transporter n=1 Tax=Kushneria aurantia TaxID=504092 RepID=A0ABV6G2Z2_9GAMM|nr:EamA family transporter [Kushneria aurantia]